MSPADLRVLQRLLNDHERWVENKMSQLSDAIASLSSQVDATSAKVGSDLASLNSQLTALQANQGSVYTATDLANLAAVQAKVAAIDAASTPPVAPAV
jgi:hypothetical protein